MKTQISENVRGNHDDAHYSAYLDRIRERFIDNVVHGAEPLFTTDASGLWKMYLDGFADPAERQHHNCHTCKQFVERFCSLVTINSVGIIEPAVLNQEDAPSECFPSIAAITKAVRRSKVTGVFLSSETVWGTPKTGPWHHLSVTPPADIVYQRGLLTAGQKMAEKREDFNNVMRALGEFKRDHIQTAVSLLRSDALYRSEKLLGQAEWLKKLHDDRDVAYNKENVVWLAVATAPAGFCHPRSGMIGTLLEDIASGMGFDDVSRRFADKMHPLRYQRPQVAPTAGAIAAAEKIVQQLGAAGSLARRFCRVDEIEALWRPTPKKEEDTTGGVFGHLTPKGREQPAGMRIPAQTMTWDKFQRSVLPTAERIEFLAPVIGAYTALVTAVNPDAPPILQWDREDARNPVSWYFWNGGAPAESFGLVPGAFYDVEAITLKPSMWRDGPSHHGKGVMFVIARARESRQCGAAIFPEILLSEFHGIRSVIEAYSRRARIEGMELPHAAGVMIGTGDKTWGAKVRVWNDGKSLDYILDRWD